MRDGIRGQRRDEVTCFFFSLSFFYSYHSDRSGHSSCCSSYIGEQKSRHIRGRDSQDPFHQHFVLHSTTYGISGVLGRRRETGLLPGIALVGFGKFWW